jgi:hypothetical protein
MRFLLLAVIISFTFSSALAQNVSLPKNPKPGKCYERCFYYDKPLEWKEIDCKKSNKETHNGANVFHVRKTAAEEAKFIKYQQELINLGYNLKANGLLDSKTVKAHHKYLKFKNKQAKKAKRSNRKNK